MPPVSMKAPARMKSGMASSTNESTPSKVCLTMTVSGYCPDHQSPRKPETPDDEGDRHAEEEQDDEGEGDRARS